MSLLKKVTGTVVRQRRTYRGPCPSSNGKSDKINNLSRSEVYLGLDGGSIQVLNPDRDGKPNVLVQVKGGLVVVRFVNFCGK